jgi:DNA-binding NtrC family response regulator
MSARVLVVDDDLEMSKFLRDTLVRRGFDVHIANNGHAALQQLDAEDYDAVVTDLRMPAMNGIELCRRVADKRPGVPVVVITAFGSLDTVVEALRAGAYDFVQKPLDADILAMALDRAVTNRKLREEVTRLRLAIQSSGDEGEILGGSPPIRELRKLIERVASSDSTVLIEGETGTGKELVARMLHKLGLRSRGPYVAVNCAAVPASLLESELFGYVRGAFTDARRDRAGLFVQAERGVLFLDEVGEFPAELQPKLLRVLQERTLRPLGSDREVPVNVQIIAATNRNLDTEVARGRFRSDLFYRLNVIRIPVPPLRSLGNDILFLSQHFLREMTERAGKEIEGISPSAAQKLLAHSWPGNVRELQNAIEQAVALAQFQQLTVEDLPESIRTPQKKSIGRTNDSETPWLTLQEVERKYILEAMDRLGGNRTEVAKILGLDRKTLYRKLKEYGVD